ncbi:MAG: hypothetical protein JGK26_19475 [Microcoleus sp. PH2017_27_LUM_O_A]|nr:hypothetical protein [Microcoleus sp. PH2017_27_LUM_O_A]
MGIQRYDFSTIALEVARSALMTIHGPKTQPNLLNTIDQFKRSAFPIRLQNRIHPSVPCFKSKIPNPSAYSSVAAFFLLPSSFHPLHPLHNPLPNFLLLTTDSGKF